MPQDFAIMADDGVTVVTVTYATLDAVQAYYPGRFILVPPRTFCEPGAIYDPQTKTFSPGPTD